MEKELIVIIPLNIFNDEVEKLLERAIKSVPSSVDIRLSVKDDIADAVSKIKTQNNVEIVPNKEGDFCSLVNNAVGGSKYFSILEFDDQYTDIWYNNFQTYYDSYPDVSMFLFLEDIYDFNDNSYIGFGNEAPLASSFSKTLGEIDNECIQEFFDFYLTGSIFNTEDWKKIGGLKTNIPLTFWYEFLLRMTNNAKRVMVIPKIGYKHYLGRKGSYSETVLQTVTEEESKYWFDVAKKESFHKKQREVKPFSKE